MSRPYHSLLPLSRRLERGAATIDSITDQQSTCGCPTYGSEIIESVLRIELLELEMDAVNDLCDMVGYSILRRWPG